MENDRGPLSHLRILDMTRALAGPYGTLILGDLGAEIIKIEGPEGELSRHFPPHYLAGDSLYFYSINRNKKSLCLDFKSPGAQQVIEDLAARCDILVENFRPGVMARLGFSYEQVRELNPRAILCSISGFGQTGPYAQRPG